MLTLMKLERWYPSCIIATCLPRLQTLLDELAPADKLIRIDTLEINLEDLDRENWELELPEEIVGQPVRPDFEV